MPNARFVDKWFACITRRPDGGICSHTLVHARVLCTRDLATARTTATRLNVLARACWRTSTRIQAKTCTLTCRGRWGSKASSFSSATNDRLWRRRAHQHRSVSVAQAISFEERFDGLFIIHNSICPRPVRTPQTALKTPDIEHTGERVPDVREGIWFLGQRAGAARY